ncbi:MAG: hypothetical protein ACKN9E_10825 [Microcystaceae cyanobacterium]
MTRKLYCNSSAYSGQKPPQPWVSGGSGEGGSWGKKTVIQAPPVWEALRAVMVPPWA